MPDIHFGDDGLCPVVVQEAGTGEVLMLAYANTEAIAKTLHTGVAHFYSRSRQELWRKGDTSGQVLRVVGVTLDCDQDAVLYKVEAPQGACHTGAHSCFHHEIHGTPAAEFGAVSARLWQTLTRRRDEGPASGSYTAGLLQLGLDRILRKVGEEAAEVLIAAKNDNDQELLGEAADLVYHLFVLLLSRSLNPDQVAEVLSTRAGGPRRGPSTAIDKR